MNRRQFVGSAALGAVPLTLIPDATAAEPANDPAVLSQALLDFAKNRFGAELTEAQVKLLHGRIQRNLATAQALRTPALTNADEPDFVFGSE